MTISTTFIKNLPSSKLEISLDSEFSALVINSLTACYVIALITFFSVTQVHSRRTRQSNNLHLPLLKKSTCKQSIKLVGVKLWNEIPNKIKQSKNLAGFKKQGKQLLLNSYYLTLFNLISFLLLKHSWDPRIYLLHS